MKKVLFCAGGVALSFAATATVFAGAVDNKTNRSAEYIRTLNRNAATDYADIATYNPAGTVKLEKGFIINGSIQYFDKVYKNNINDVEYESDEPSYLPGAFGVYNRGRWSLFLTSTVVGGGGKVDFSQGDATTFSIGDGISTVADRTVDGMVQGGGGPAAPLGTYYDGTIMEQRLSGESYYLGYAFGGAYSINDMVSVSLAVHYVDAFRTATGKVTVAPTQAGAMLGATPITANVDYDQDGEGWGGIIGLNLAPNDVMNIGMRYETKTDLDLTASVYTDDQNILASLPMPIIDGQSLARDLPALLGLGFSYKITPKLRTEVNFTYYFNEDADWSGVEASVNNGYDLGIALEYRFNDRLLASIGYMHTELGVDPENFLPENPELDANTIGAGIAYAFNKKFHANFAVGNTFYQSDSYVDDELFLSPPTTIEYEKNVFFLALGLEYRFM